MVSRGQILLAVAPELGETISISGPGLEALRAFRTRPGEAVTVTVAGGRSWRARVARLKEQEAELVVFEEMIGPAEPRLELFLLQALPDKERMELIIEKATELGVAVIVPWMAERGTSLAEREARQPKAHRWAERARRAMKQCRRGRVPAILPCQDLAAAISAAASAQAKIVLHDRAPVPLRAALAAIPPPPSLAIVIGPEGGLSDPELEALAAAGFVPAHLGPRVLRAETAAIAALVIAQWIVGDWGREEGESRE